MDIRDRDRPSSRNAFVNFLNQVMENLTRLQVTEVPPNTYTEELEERSLDEGVQLVVQRVCDTLYRLVVA